MRYLRQNTATIVTVGPFYDKTDGVTIETALTITNERISMTVDLNDGSAPTLVLDNVTGATSGTSNDLNYITNCDAGLMQLELAAANVNYVGRAFLTITDAANHCPVFHEFTILPGQVYDSLILGTDLLDSSAAQLAGTACTGRDIGASVLLSSGTGTGQISLSSGAVLLQATQTGVTIPTVTAVTTVNGLAANSVTAAAIADGAIDAATFAAGAITAAAIATDAIDADALAADAIAEINATVDTALADINLDHLCGTATGIPALPADTWLDTIRDDGATGVFDRTTDSLQAIKDASVTAAALVDLFCDEPLAGHTTAGTVGKGIADASSAGDPWATAIPGAYSAGTAGKILGDNIDAAISSRLAPTTATRTLDVTAGGAAGIDWGNVENPTTSVGLSGTTVAAVTVATNNDKAGYTVTTVSDKTGYALSAAGNTAAADALLTRDMSAVTEGSGRSPLQALRILRNKWTLAADTLTVYKENDSTTSWSAATTTTVMNPINSVDPS